MNTKELSQLRYLKKEIEITQTQITEIERSIEETESWCSASAGQLQEELAHCKRQLERRVKKSVSEYKRLVCGIAKIKDSLLRQILILRFIQGLTWLQTAGAIGGGNTPDGIRMMVKRYLQRAGESD